MTKRKKRPGKTEHGFQFPRQNGKAGMKVTMALPPDVDRMLTELAAHLQLSRNRAFCIIYERSAQPMREGETMRQAVRRWAAVTYRDVEGLVSAEIANAHKQVFSNEIKQHCPQ